MLVSAGAYVYYAQVRELKRAPLKSCPVGVSMRGGFVPMYTAADEALCARVQAILTVPASGKSSECRVASKCGTVWRVLCPAHHGHSHSYYVDEIKHAVVFETETDRWSDSLLEFQKGCMHPSKSTPHLQAWGKDVRELFSAPPM